MLSDTMPKFKNFEIIKNEKVAAIMLAVDEEEAKGMADRKFGTGMYDEIKDAGFDRLSNIE